MNETEEVYKCLEENPPNYLDGWRCDIEKDRIIIYPDSGGCIILKSNGTWEGDIAPNCD